LSLSESIYAEENTPLVRTQANIILKSDRSTLDGKTGMFEHCGNALLTQPGLRISADCLIGRKNEAGTFDFIAAKGSPAIFEQENLEKKEYLKITANVIEYKVPVQQFIISENAALNLSNTNEKNKENSVQILAHRIALDNINTSSRKIDAKGSPLKMVLIKSNNIDLKAESKKLNFNTGTSNLELSEDVVANLELGQITAGVFNYNSETKVSSFEKSKEQQIEIIQKKKKNK
jgi:lipopolysaccharide transport protein LptA